MNANFNSTIVNQNEVNALREMIFARVQERNASMVDLEQEQIMDLARNSFVSENNPFSAIIKQTEQQVNPVAQSNADSIEQNSIQSEEIGFPVKHMVPQASNQNRIISEQITAAAINNTMQDAREGLANKKSFMGALNFLNSQAAISLIKTRADKFEMVV